MTRTVPVERVGGMTSRGAGLDAAEVEARRQRWGTNTIVEAPSRSWIAVARDTARDPMIWFLVGTAALYACSASSRGGDPARRDRPRSSAWTRISTGARAPPRQG